MFYRLTKSYSYIKGNYNWELIQYRKTVNIILNFVIKWLNSYLKKTQKQITKEI
jgi:hypothetical protein